MKKTFALVSGTFIALAVPFISSAAQSVNSISDVGSFIINTINHILVPIVFALAFFVFVWGAFQTFIMGATNDTAKEKGKELMLWGLIGFFVMLSVWGLVGILTGSVNLNNNPVTQPVTGQVGG